MPIKTSSKLESGVRISIEFNEKSFRLSSFFFFGRLVIPNRPTFIHSISAKNCIRTSIGCAPNGQPGRKWNTARHFRFPSRSVCVRTNESKLIKLYAGFCFGRLRKGKKKQSKGNWWVQKSGQTVCSKIRLRRNLSDAFVWTSSNCSNSLVGAASAVSPTPPEKFQMNYYLLSSISQ